MKESSINANIRRYVVRLEKYVMHQFPVRAGNMAVRFVNGNFRAQGWQGNGFERWPANKRKGTVLVRRGQLRRGTYYTVSPGAVTVRNNVPYAAVHNLGLNARISIKSHTRRILSPQRIATGKILRSGRQQMRTVHKQTGIRNVKAHTRNVKIPQRQFMPTSSQDSPILLSALRREIERELKMIFK